MRASIRRPAFLLIAVFASAGGIFAILIANIVAFFFVRAIARQL